jgi:hypothetical protein
MPGTRAAYISVKLLHMSDWTLAKQSELADLLHGDQSSLNLTVLSGEFTHFTSLRHTHIAGRSLPALVGIKVGFCASTVSVDGDWLIMKMETLTREKVISRLSFQFWILRVRELTERSSLSEDLGPSN